MEKLGFLQDFHFETQLKLMKYGSYYQRKGAIG